MPIIAEPVLERWNCCTSRNSLDEEVTGWLRIARCVQSVSGGRRPGSLPTTVEVGRSQRVPIRVPRIRMSRTRVDSTSSKRSAAWRWPVHDQLLRHMLYSDLCPNYASAAVVRSSRAMSRRTSRRSTVKPCSSARDSRRLEARASSVITVSRGTAAQRQPMQSRATERFQGISPAPSRSEHLQPNPRSKA